MKRVLFAAIVACGPAAHPVAKKAEPPKREDAWQKLGFEERHSVMTFTVLPNMGRTWRDWKKTEWPEMTCRTCHGKDAESVSYRMPNPALPPIDPAHPPANAAAEFMKSRVVPENGILIVRLSDGQSWPLVSQNTPWAYAYPIALTCTELFAAVSDNNIANVVRVRLDSLGVGLAPN